MPHPRAVLVWMSTNEVAIVSWDGYFLYRLHPLSVREIADPSLPDKEIQQPRVKSDSTFPMSIKTVLNLKVQSLFLLQRFCPNSSSY